MDAFDNNTAVSPNINETPASGVFDSNTVPASPFGASSAASSAFGQPAQSVFGAQTIKIPAIDKKKAGTSSFGAPSSFRKPSQSTIGFGKFDHNTAAARPKGSASKVKTRPILVAYRRGPQAKFRQQAQDSTFGANNTNSMFGKKPFDAATPVPSTFNSGRKQPGTSATTGVVEFVATNTSNTFADGGGHFGSQRASSYGATDAKNPNSHFANQPFGSATSTAPTFGHTLQGSPAFVCSGTNGLATTANPTTPTITTGVFGQTSTTSTSTTAATGVFCAGCNGTAIIRYQEMIGTDTIYRNGNMKNVSTKQHCITYMKEYEDNSLEELRMDDYMANRRGPQSKFGQPPQNGVNSANNTNSIFGATTSAPTAGLFGSTTSTAPTFRQTFGQANTAHPATLIGAGTQSNAGVFGQTLTTSTSTTAATGVFRSGCNRTAIIRYQEMIGTDTMDRNGQTKNVSTKQHCITFIKEYEDNSLEELRMDDYMANRRGPQSKFGQPPQNGVNSSNNTNSIVGAAHPASLFGAGTQSIAGVLGQTWGTFGATTTSTASTGFGGFSRATVSNDVTANDIIAAIAELTREIKNLNTNLSSRSRSPDRTYICSIWTYICLIWTYICSIWFQLGQ